MGDEANEITDRYFGEWSSPAEIDPNDDRLAKFLWAFREHLRMHMGYL